MQWNEFRTHVRHLPTRDQERIRKAFDLAKELHKDQLRKSGEPYFMHPLAVATMLVEMHADADSLVTAFLHDSIEDTEISLDDIRKRFGDGAAMLIDGVTKLYKEELQDFPTLDQEIESLRKIFTYMEKDIRIMVIKLADRLHNMQTVEFLAPERQASLAQETLDIYVRIADRLSMQDLRDELEGLCIAVLEPELAMTLQELRLRNEHRGEDIIRKHLKVLHKSALTLPPHLELRYERKTWKNLRAQANEEGNTATGLSTLTTIFLNDTISECYETLGIIHQQWPYEILSFKDFISAPAINGYKGLHTTIILQDGTRVRCKIRTREMHEYARKGVAALCFDAKTIGMTHYLPWAKRISPLSKDTAERSEEFWESLQSDILGKSIMVYGHDDSAMQLPKGATALDGIFYLFGRQGIRTKEIQINGKTVDFSEELPNACRLNATFSVHEEVALPWLQYVHTGIASALIRQGLARAPHAQKIDIGEALIRSAIRQRSKVDLKELETDALTKRLQALGIASIEMLYTQVAEGKIHPEKIALSLFPETKTKKISTTRWSFHAFLPVALGDRIGQIFRAFPFRSLSIRQTDHHVHTSAEFEMDQRQAESFRTSIGGILRADQWSLVRTSTMHNAIVAAVLLILLWGLDPVFARIIIQDGLNPYDLTVLRFIALFVSASVVYLLQSLFSQQKYKPLSPLSPTLIASSAALLLTAFTTYLTLTLLPPTQYILFIISGLTITALLQNVFSRSKWWWRLLVSFLAEAGCIAFLALQQGSSGLGLLFAAASALSFALYSRVSGSYQRQSFHARYPAYLFWLSILAMPLVFVLLPFTNLLALPPILFLKGTAFVIVFSILPYGLYYECMRHFRSALLDNALPFVLFSTLIGEALFTHTLLPFFVTPLLIVLLWQYSTAEKHPA